jgi:putative ABC transport system permease protein
VAAELLFAAWGTRLMFVVFKLDSLYLPMRPLDSIVMDSRVFTFALLVSCLTGLLFGIAPALSALRGDVNEPLKEGGRSASTSGRNRLRHVLVASEMALALVVLSGAGLMLKSMRRLLGVDPGLDPKNVLITGMSLPQEEIYVGPPGLPRFCRTSTITSAIFRVWFPWERWGKLVPAISKKMRTLARRASPLRIAAMTGRTCPA